MDQSLIYPTSQSTSDEQEVDDEDLPPLSDSEWDMLYAKHTAGEVLTDYDRRRFNASTFGTSA